MTQYVTKEGLQKMKDELEHRESVVRLEIADRLSAAKELGDLSENAEYGDAREQREQNEARISELRDNIQNAVIIDPSQQASGIVSIGSTVTASCDGKDLTVTIVGANEADPSKGLISNETPFGKAFMGKKKGENAEVETPAKVMKCKITAIK